MNITTTNNNLNGNNTTNLVTSRARVHNQLDANHGSYKIFVNTNIQDIQDTLTNTTSLNSVITISINQYYPLGKHYYLQLFHKEQNIHIYDRLHRRTAILHTIRIKYNFLTNRPSVCFRLSDKFHH